MGEGLLSEMVAAGIHFECCPTSSLETGAWQFGSACDWRKHPIKGLVRSGASVGINSDDPSVFDTTLIAEFELAEERMGLSSIELKACTLAAIDAAFVGKAEKA